MYSVRIITYVEGYCDCFRWNKCPHTFNPFLFLGFGGYKNTHKWGNINSFDVYYYALVIFMPIHQCNASTRMNETGKRVKSIVDDNVKSNGMVTLLLQFHHADEMRSIMQKRDETNYTNA